MIHMACFAALFFASGSSSSGTRNRLREEKESMGKEEEGEDPESMGEEEEEEEEEEAGAAEEVEDEEWHQDVTRPNGFIQAHVCTKIDNLLFRIFL